MDRPVESNWSSHGLNTKLLIHFKCAESENHRKIKANSAVLPKMAPPNSLHDKFNTLIYSCPAIVSCFKTHPKLKMHFKY